MKCTCRSPAGGQSRRQEQEGRSIGVLLLRLTAHPAGHAAAATGRDGGGAVVSRQQFNSRPQVLAVHRPLLMLPSLVKDGHAGGPAEDISITLSFVTLTRSHSCWLTHAFRCWGPTCDAARDHCCSFAVVDGRAPLFLPGDTAASRSQRPGFTATSRRSWAQAEPEDKQAVGDMLRSSVAAGCLLSAVLLQGSHSVAAGRLCRQLPEQSISTFTWLWRAAVGVLLPHKLLQHWATFVALCSLGTSCCSHTASCQMSSLTLGVAWRCVPVLTLYSCLSHKRHLNC